MSALLPCPFCGAGVTAIDPKYHWTGMGSVLLSVTVTHWCGEGLRSAYLAVKAATEAEAIAAWNTRAPVDASAIRLEAIRDVRREVEAECWAQNSRATGWLMDLFDRAEAGAKAKGGADGT